MKLRDWLRYLLYFLLVFLLIVAKEYVGKLGTAYFNTTFKMDYFLFGISLILGVCIGLALGVESFIREMKKEGNWRINMPKLIIFGLPSLYFGSYYLWAYYGTRIFGEAVYYPIQLLMKYSNMNYIPLFQVILGYVIITSFYRYKRDNFSGK